MKHVAILRGGGRVDITLPLKAAPAYFDPSMWRVDQNGVLLNLEHLAAIVGAPEPQPLPPAHGLGHAFRSYAGGKYCAAIVGPHRDRRTCAMPPEMH